MYNYSSIEIKGYRDRKIPNTYLQQHHTSNHLAILLPGLGYTCDNPLLHYTAKTLLNHGADVIRVEYGYNRIPEFAKEPKAAQLEWLYQDVKAAFETLIVQKPYQKFTLTGKSLGTLAMRFLLQEFKQLSLAKCIWLTPILSDEALRLHLQKATQPGLVAIGSADPLCRPDWIDEISDHSKPGIMMIDGADHSLEQEDVLRSISDLSRLMETINRFLE